MTNEEIKNTPELVDFMLDKCVLADSRAKVRKRLEEVCNIAIKALEQQPCEDAISRQAVKDMLMREWIRYIPMDLDVNLSFVLAKVDELPLVTPQYTEAEIQKMQELEQAEIQKAYELGKAEQPCEDAISRQEVLETIEREEFKGDAISEIEKLPLVTPQPKIGSWEWMPYTHNLNTELLGDWCCSECKSVVVECVPAECGVPLYKHCPQCGAKMQEVEE